MDRGERLMRQLDLVHPEKLEDTKVVLIGAGGIGSFLGQFLAKMGVTDLTIYDFDDVEVENLPNQMYPDEALGTPKAKALAAEIERLDPACKVTAFTEKVTSATKLQGVVISAVDSLEARAEIWGAVKMNMDVPLFLDARMGSEIGQVRAVNPLSLEQQKKFELSMQGTPVDLPCTAKAIVYNGGMIASLLANQVKRFAMGEEVPAEIMFSFPDLESGGGLLVTV